ncbi:murein biosynthesis integral membrane protein MurJ [Patescibacteria group bacterium]|nr:murein biosynthesis integral membrane protein MurJ [Patescibacteria group bacterium]
MFASFRRFLTQESSGIARGALVVSLASFVSRLLGLLRDRMLAGHFGAGIELDAYYAAFRIPDALFNLFIAGALSAGFIPLFSEYLEQRSEKEAWELAAQVLSFLTAAIGVAAIIFVIFAPQLIPLMAHGFSPEGQALTITMSRIMALSPVLLGISGVIGAILQTKKRFLAFAFAPVFYNIGILFGILVLSRGFGIAGVALGVVVGALLHASIQAIPAFQLGLRGVWRRPRLTPGVSRLLSLMIPRTASLAVSQINLIVILSLASTLTVGSVARFTLATNIQSLPFGLVGVSVAVAAFPVLSQAVNMNDMDRFARVLCRQLRWLWFLLAPLSVLFVVLAPEIMYVTLGNGKFDVAQIQQTASILRWLVIGLPAQGMVALLVRAYYAKKNTWTPFLISLVAEAVNIILCLSLRSTLGLTGFAIAFTASTISNVLGLWLWLPDRRQMLKEEIRTLARVFGGVGLATIGMAALMHVLTQSIILTHWSLIRVSVYALGVSILPIAAYFGIALLCGLQEPRQLWQKVRR